jgi:hypothetical protein
MVKTDFPPLPLPGSTSLSTFTVNIAPNLIVVTGAQATKINWMTAKDKSGNVVASGVSFVPTGQNGPAVVIVRRLFSCHPSR